MWEKTKVSLMVFLTFMLASSSWLVPDVVSKQLQLPKLAHPLKPDSAIKSVGVQKVLVLLMEFPDQKGVMTYKSAEEKFVSDKVKSLKNYFDTASGGKLKIDFGSFFLHDWIKMPKTIEEYNQMGVPDHVMVLTMGPDAYKAAQEKGLKIEEYDEDGNGYPDLTIFIWAGNSYGDGTKSVPGDFYRGDVPFPLISIGENIREGGFPLGTTLHEFFHGMGGLYDLYDYSHIVDPVGGWDLMGSGLEENYWGMSSFSRFNAGWVDIETITEPGTYEIDDLNGDGEHKAYKIQIPGSIDEWILLENRQKHGADGYYNGCPGNGIVMYHVDDRRPYGGRFNTITSEWSTPGIAILDPGGAPLHKTANYGADIGKTKISGTTIPNTLPYIANSSRETLCISDISNVGSKMTFKVTFESPQIPLVRVNEQLPFGQVEKGTAKTQELKFTNAGAGKLQAFLKTDCKWITLDRTSFIGNDEAIIVTIDTSQLPYGINKGQISFNCSSIIGRITVSVEVVPILGDINLDQKVDEKDFDELAACFGKSESQEGYKKEADLNKDGIIDWLDLMILARNIGRK
ncbi:MAG: dockerin type I domain-containing protein [Caldisericales bacterium]|nr:dockerin type I domain-containing protein [bacterium]